jgi:hypothetical protein
MSGTETLTDKVTLEGLDFEILCDSKIAFWDAMKNQPRDPQGPCNRPAQWAVTKHLIMRGCTNTQGYVCDPHYQHMKGATCPRCGAQLYKDAVRI